MVCWLVRKLWKRITGLNEVVFAVLLCMSIESYDFIVYGMLSSIMAKVFFLQSAFLSDQGDRATYLSSLMGF